MKTKKPIQSHSFSRYKLISSILIFLLVIACSLLFINNALASNSSIGVFKLNENWRESCVWLVNNTPDTGLDFLKNYDKSSYELTPESYGIMSWWDYGHIILELGNRAPNANPFQFGVDGDYGAARFFITTKEDVATKILDKLRTKYVMTDSEMATSKFVPMAIWNNTVVGGSPFMQTYILPNPGNPNTWDQVIFFQKPYYETMVSRLHNFDGSMKEPNKVYFIQYMKPKENQSAPVIVNGQEIDYDQGLNLTRQFNQSENLEYEVTLVNPLYTSPVSEVEALHHFRLIHESPDRTTPAELPDIRYVKTFEYVNGAHISGDGILEILVKTNTGREFRYRQRSVNGSFIVPYPTNMKIGDIETLGLYTNLDSGKQFVVTEEQVQNGNMIQ